MPLSLITAGAVHNARSRPCARVAKEFIDQLSSQLGKQTASGAAWSVGSQGVTVAVSFLATSMLARLVSPGDFGMVAMVAAVIGFGELFRDFGLTNAVIQAPSISREEKSNLFWLNTAIGSLLTIIVFFLAEPIEDFYQRDDLANVVQILSVTFLINGIATQPRANLIRDLRTKAIAVVDVIAVIMALIISLVLALGGMGLWAIVALQ